MGMRSCNPTSYQQDRLMFDLRNNPRISESDEKYLKGGVAHRAKASNRYDATYGEDSFNAGVLEHMITPLAHQGGGPTPTAAWPQRPCA